MSPADPGLRLGRIGAWLNPVYGDDARTGLAIQVLTSNGNDPIPACRQLARVLL